MRTPIRKAMLMGLPLMVVLFALFFLIAIYWLLNTTSGATWLWSRLEGLESVDVRSSRVSGDLASGFVIENMEYRSESLDLLVRHTEVEAGVDWWPLAIRVDSLSVQDVEVYSRTTEAQGLGDNGETDIRNTLAGIELPLPLEFSNVALTGISLQQDDNPRHILAESVRFKAALDERLVIDQLDIVAIGIEAKGQGYLYFEPPFELAATIGGRLEKAMVTGQSVLELPFKLESSGNLDKVQLQLSSQKFGLQLAAEILEPVSSPGWNIQAMLERLQWPQGQVEPDVTLSGLNLSSRGTIDNWSFELDTGLDSGYLENIRFALSGSGSASMVDISESTLAGPGLDLGLSGTLDWSRQAEAGLKAVIRQLDLSPWVSEWPRGEMLAGELDLSWSGSGLKIPASQLTVTGTGVVVGLEADIDIDSNSIDGRLDWSKLRWPLKSDRPRFSSESGRLQINGSVDDWLVEGSLVVQIGEYPQGQFEIQGGGNRTSSSVLVPVGRILGGTLSGKAEADWSAGVNWHAVIQAEGIDPAPLLPGWPGRLNSDIEVAAQGQTGEIQVRLSALQGTLRDVPISAHGGLDIDGSRLAFQSMEVRTDEAVLELDGAGDTAEGLMVKFNGNLPSALLQGARGSLELEGRYSEHASQPLLELELQGLDLLWNDLSVSNLAVTTPGSATVTGFPAIQLDATGVTVNDVMFEKLSLALNPAGDQVELRANLLGEDIVLNSVMNLESKDGIDLPGGDWQGELGALDLAIGQAYHFALSKPASLAWSPDSASLGPLCLSENSTATLCLDLNYQGNGDWSLVADADAVPLDYLRDFLELDIHFEQLVEGRLEWRQPRGKPPTGGADFRITGGRVLDLVDNDVLTQSNEGHFAFKLQNGNLESGVLDIEFPGTGFIDVGFDVLDIMAGGEKAIQGRALARLDHFKLAGQLVLPGVDAVDGQFESDIQLGGSVADPEFDGAFRFSNGFIHYFPIGLQLEDIEFEGRVRRRDSGEFSGQFRAGEGLGELNGRFVFDDIGSARLEIDLAGEQLLLVNTDELKMLTETDLELVLGPQRMDINGRVTIPSARLTAANLQLGVARDSEDLVIENPGAEPVPAAAEAPERSQIHGQLEVSLGDDVLVKVPGVETTITGSTLFNWSGDSVPMAEGGYTLQGVVDVYGPRLTINNGSISFPSVPANDPVLNIRAGRDIFGNTQIRRAGVRVIGSLKRPVLEAYTVPVTNEDRAWTLLITGTDFDQGQGISGFDVGTYIAPRLFVSYGVSLFEDENVISARYDLDRGFGIKVTSGQRETGIDVSYTIDR